MPLDYPPPPLPECAEHAKGTRRVPFDPRDLLKRPDACKDFSCIREPTRERRDPPPTFLPPPTPGISTNSAQHNLTPDLSFIYIKKRVNRYKEPQVNVVKQDIKRKLLTLELATLENATAEGNATDRDVCRMDEIKDAKKRHGQRVVKTKKELRAALRKFKETRETYRDPYRKCVMPNDFRRMISRFIGKVYEQYQLDRESEKRATMKRKSDRVDKETFPQLNEEANEGWETEQAEKAEEEYRDEFIELDYAVDEVERRPHLYRDDKHHSDKDAIWMIKLDDKYCEEVESKACLIRSMRTATIRREDSIKTWVGRKLGNGKSIRGDAEVVAALNRIRGSSARKLEAIIDEI